MFCPLIGKSRPQVGVIAKLGYEESTTNETPMADRHQLVKWVLRYSTEGKGR
jgi:hypothetical protein